MRSYILRIALIVFSVCSFPSLAGTVHFDPLSATITPATPSVNFDVSVSWDTLPTIDTVNVVIFGDLGANLTFEFAQSFIDSTTLPLVLPIEDTWFCGIAGCPYDDVSFGANRLPPASGWTSPLLIGTLTVDTSALTAQDQIEVFVDSQGELDNLGAVFSLVANGAYQEPLYGAATIAVVPEPATVGFLLVVLSAAMCRRKQVSR